MSWSRFDTAPIDRPFLAYCPGKGVEVLSYVDGRLALHFDQLFVDDVYSIEELKFTHWSECPEPPQVSQQ